MIGQAIYTLLTGASAVSALVGTRVYPDMATQDAVYPFIVYSEEGADPSDTKDGVSTLDVVGLQIVVFSNSYATAQTLAEAARVALDRAGGIIGGVDIDSIRFTGQNSNPMNFDKHVFIIEQSYSVRKNRTR